MNDAEHIKSQDDEIKRLRRTYAELKESFLADLKVLKSAGAELKRLRPIVSARPTTRQRLRVHEPVSRHTLMKGDAVVAPSVSTELSPLHRTLLKLLRVPATDYRD